MQQEIKIHYVVVKGTRIKLEGSHPVVYRQTFITLVPSIHNICKDQMY